MGTGRAARGAAAFTAVVLAVLSLGGRAHAADSTLLFHYADAQIDESSGLAPSSYVDGVVYTFNDSGDTARFFAVNASGATVAIYTLKGELAVGAYWAVGVNGTLHAFPVPAQQQDEGIAFTRDGRSILVDSEGQHTAVYQLPLPAEAIAADAAAGGAPPAKPTTRPIPTVKPTAQATVKPTVQPSDTASLAASASAQNSLPITTSLPTSSLSFESPAPALASSALVSTLPGPTEAASSGARQPQVDTTLTSVNEGRGWLLWIAVPFAILAVGFWLLLAARFRWWPWRRS